MPEPSDQAAQGQRRANWVGLRTLRQRPKLVGTMTDGEPIYEVRSVRLVLRAQAACFNRLVPCERCGQDQPGAPVLNAADLDAPVRPVICTDCVRKAGVSSVWEPEVTRPVTDRTARPTSKVEPKRPLSPGAPGAPAPPPARPAPAARLGAVVAAAPQRDDGRIEQLQRQFEAVTGRVEELARVAGEQRTALTEARAELAAVTEASAAKVAALEEQRAALTQARAELAAVTEASAAKVAAMEEQVQQRVGGLTQLIEAQRADLNVIVTAMNQIRAEVERVADATQQLARAQQRLEERAAGTERDLSSAVARELADVEVVFDQRLHGVAGEVTQASARLEALERRIEALVGQLVDSRRTGAEARTGPGEGVKLVEALEAQLQGASDRLAALSGGRRSATRTQKAEMSTFGMMPDVTS